MASRKRPAKRKPKPMTTEQIAKALLAQRRMFTGEDARDALVDAEKIRADTERKERLSRALRKLRRKPR